MIREFLKGSFPEIFLSGNESFQLVRIKFCRNFSIRILRNEKISAEWFLSRLFRLAIFLNCSIFPVKVISMEIT